MYKWKQKDLNDLDIEKSLLIIEDIAKQIYELRGKITDSLVNFKKYNEHLVDVNKIANELVTNSTMGIVLNPTDKETQKKYQRVLGIVGNSNRFIAFARIEILNNETKVLKFFDDPELKKIKSIYTTMFKINDYRLKPEEENILRDFLPNITSAKSIYLKLINQDLRFAPMKDSKGKEHPASFQNFSFHLFGRDSVLREAAYKTLWSGIGAFVTTLSTLYVLHINAQNKIAKHKGFDSALSSVLFTDDFPLEMLNSIISNVVQNANTGIKWKKIMAKVTKISNPDPWDWNGPLFHSDKKFSKEEAIKNIKIAFKPLGKYYLGKIDELIENDLIDLTDTITKRRFPVTIGGGNTKPYISVFWDESVFALISLSEEVAKAVHLLHSSEKQIFEFASPKNNTLNISGTLGKYLMTEHLLLTLKDKESKQFILEKSIKEFNTFVYRSAMFLDFEKWSHENVMAKKEMELNEYFEEISKTENKYFPKTKDEKKIFPSTSLWPFASSNFYEDFSVYRSLTSYICGLNLAIDILNKEHGVVKRYIEFLNFGSSLPLFVLLQKVGADPSSHYLHTSIFHQFETWIDTLDKSI